MTMTSATTPRHLWMDTVTTAAIALGIGPEWLRESQQRGRLNRYYSAGEPAWMAVDAIRQFWSGLQRAAIADQDGLGAIRAAVKGAR